MSRPCTECCHHVAVHALDLPPCRVARRCAVACGPDQSSWSDAQSWHRHVPCAWLSSCTPQSCKLYGLSWHGPARGTSLAHLTMTCVYMSFYGSQRSQASTGMLTSCALAGQAWEELAALRAPESGCTMDLRSRDAAVRAWARLAASGLLPCLDPRYSSHQLRLLHTWPVAHVGTVLLGTACCVVTKAGMLGSRQARRVPVSMMSVTGTPHTPNQLLTRSGIGSLPMLPQTCP